MILLIEPDKTIRKRLSDLLNRERIMGIDSVQEVLEMLCKYKTEINVIVANIYQLRNIIARQTLFRLCEKFVIAIPPIVNYYREEEKKSRKKSREITNNIDLFYTRRKIPVLSKNTFRQ